MRTYSIHMRTSCNMFVPHSNYCAHFFLNNLQDHVTLGQFCDFLLEPPLKYEDCAEVKHYYNTL